MSENMSKDNAYLDKFRKDTGIWPPGRDRPRAYGEEDICEMRMQAFRYWQNTEAELARLQGVVEKLPKTADGVVLFDGETVYASFRDGVFKGEVIGGSYRKNRVGIRFEQTIQLTDDIAVHETDPLAKCLYSTKAAAEAARDE
jgi:hypothetical protein